MSALRTSRHSPAQHTELWRVVPGWPGYDVSDAGRVRWAAGDNTGNLLTQSPSTTAKWNRWPYACVRLGTFIEGKRVWRHVRVHRVVMAAFVGPLPEGMEVNHKDGDHWNNRLENLEYVTKRQNEDHAVATGRRAAGERAGMAVLTADAVRFIRSDTTLSIRELCQKFGVGPGAIGHARARRTWRHVV